MGMIYTTATGQNDLAANELQQALHLDSTSAEAHAALAKLYAAQNRSADVIPNYQRAIDLAPDDWRWPNALGTYLLSKGKSLEASEQYRRVVMLTPDNAYGFINLGISFRRQERYPEAEKALRQALMLNPQSAPALTGLGAVLLVLGKYPEAAMTYRKAIELAPADFVMRGNLAAAYQLSPGGRGKAREEYLAAIELAEKARREQPQRPSILANLGAYYAAVGDQTRALPLLRQALALSPEEPGILVLAGEGFELAGHRNEAVESISKALDLGYSAMFIERSPELADLRKDPKFLARRARLR